MKTVICSKEEAILGAARQLLETIEKKPDAALACSAADEELPVLRALSALAKERGVSLSQLRLYAACEFVGLAPGSERRISNRILAALEGSGFDPARLAVPSGDDCVGIDARLAREGGLDLALLGLGVNCRVAFNEPATPYASACHVQKLTDRSRAELAPLFGGPELVPEKGVTLGFRAICGAKSIVVIALGEQKSEAVFHTLYGRDDSVYPGAFLQLPPNVTLYADAEAAAKL